MAERPEDLGLKVLFEGEDPHVDVVAVHGLGATPSWAWIRKVQDGDEEKHINWLADENMLPSKLPSSRIMTFNYESKWLQEAPKQRRSLCALQLLTALDHQRKEEKSTEHRPIIFIGHSYGGVVIEQSLVSANAHGGEFLYLASSTVGILFLGTPHRGTQAGKWGEYIAKSAKTLGYGSEECLLKDLREDSEGLRDLLYEFSLWANRSSLKIVCCFEQHKTDYGKRFMGTWRELVVDESSACIHGHRKVPLPTDHLKINKYAGPHDPSYDFVYPLILDMARQAVQILHSRVYPWTRTIAEDNSNIQNENLACLQSLSLSNPPDDLAAIRHAKGQRVDGTCEWVLTLDQYRSWFVEDGAQLLWLSGGPGIGKTMISSFLVKELKQLVELSSNATLAYYFCDDKHDIRRTSVALLRGLLLQLLRQRPALFKHLRPDFDIFRDRLFDDFHSLWRIFIEVVTDPDAGSVYCLIDALDECDVQSRRLLLVSLGELLHNPQNNLRSVKFAITSRPSEDIVELLPDTSPAIKHISVDTGKVNHDLATFIKFKVEELSTKKRYAPDLEQTIKQTLVEKAGGTFLYVSLVLDDLSRAKIHSQVRKKLQALPSDLNKVYDKILSQIDPDCIEVARSVLSWVAIAQKPLTLREIALGRALEPSELSFPPNHILDETRNDFKCCEPLVYVNANNNTLNLVHQSAKEYLLGGHLLENVELSKYHIVEDRTNFLIFWASLKYIALGQSGRDRSYLGYSDENWYTHAAAASLIMATEYEIRKEFLDQAQILRDTWLHLAASASREMTSRLLLESGADVNHKPLFGGAPLVSAAERGHQMIVKLLITHCASLESGNTYRRSSPLSAAILKGHEEIVRLLLDSGANLSSRNSLGFTPLHYAAKSRQEATVRLLLDYGVDPRPKSRHGIAPLHIAAVYGQEAMVKLLLTSGADLEDTDNYGTTPLMSAARGGYEGTVRLLLDHGADVGARNKDGRTVLLDVMNLRRGYASLEMIGILLNAGADPNAKDKNGDTALLAAAGRKTNHAKLLLDRGADPCSENNTGRSARSTARLHGNKELVELLKVAEIMKFGSSNIRGS